MSLCFVHPAQADLLMRVQPLRAFHTIYLVGAVLLGGALAARAPRPWLLPLSVLAGVLAVGMFLDGRDTYGPVSQIELPSALGGPGSGSADAWQKAFLWVRSTVPATAVLCRRPAVP